MPPLSSYTPFESLLFFQSLATCDTRPASFAAISELLKANPFVRQDVTFDAKRLDPQALEDLYTTLVTEGLESRGGTTSTSGNHSPNPKKRKVAVPRLQDARTQHSTIIPDLVPRLYAAYKERVTQEIKQEEQRYREIKEEITKLESHPPEQSPPAQAAPQAPGHVATPNKEPDEPRAPEEQPKYIAPIPLKSPASTSAVKTKQPIQQSPIPAASPTQRFSGGTKAQQNAGPQFIMEQGFVSQPQAQPARNGYQQIHPKTEPKLQPAPTKPTNVPIPPYRQAAQFPNPSFSSAGPSPSFPSVPSSQQHIKPAPATSPPVINHLQTSQVPPAPHGTPTTHPQHAWYPHPTTQSPAYGHISPYTNAPYPNNHIPSGQFPPMPPNPYGHVPPPGNFQSPYQIPGQQNHHLPSQGPFVPQQATSQAATAPPAKPAVGLVGNMKVEIPSFSKSLAQRRPISRTPWKLPDPITIPQRPGSPVPPRPEDISPISDRAPSPGFQVPSNHRGSAKGFNQGEKGGLQEFENPPAASTRSRKTTPARGRGRGTAFSPSVAHSTRSRSRGFSVTSRDEDTDATTVQTKIKKEVPSTPAGISEDVEYRSGIKRKRISSGFIADDGQLSTGHATQFVRCSQNFGRTSGPILNNVATHKYASIFAKPLTEREAPGYRSLIYRPQDIKSIKSAIHQGSKAISAATEAGEAETPGSASGSGTTPSKTNGLIIKKTADLVPPKAIVNSSQLEKELIRMFANAVMFNPTSEHTFGPAFPMRTETRSREGTQNSELEEGGIISDTLAMYEDVEKAVSTWRSVERGSGDMGNNGGHLSLRRGSTSDINMDGAVDEGK